MRKPAPHRSQRTSKSAPSSPRPWSKAALNTLFQNFSRENPAPKTELIAPNPFCLLVAIVLSAQATDVSVNKATKALFTVADSPKKIAALGVDGLSAYIKTIGLYNSKAKHVIALCERLINVFAGQVPHTRDALMSLPGVGRKTANVWLNCVLGQPTMAVDTHVFRVGNRLGLTRAKTPEQSETQLLKIIPKQWLKHAHHWLILHGRYVCKARKPECGHCAVSSLCRYEAKTL